MFSALLLKSVISFSLWVCKSSRSVFHFGSEARVSVINFSGSGMSDSISVIKQKVRAQNTSKILN